MASTVLPNGIIIPEKFSRDWYADLYHNWLELDNLLGGGTPKDGTLTIQKNGSTVGTFSANQATNETIDITVPTATSELTNDSNFVESSDLATVATSGSYTDLSDKPTIPTVNDATLTIQQNGTAVDTFTANSSTDKTVNIQCVDLTNNQTVAGNKTFSGNVFFNPYRVKIKHSSQEIGVVPSANQWNGINFIDKNNSSTFSIEQGFLSNGNTIIHFSMTPNIVGGSPLRIFESTYNASTNEIATKSRTLIPDANNSRDLGTSTNKWKSLNGINPGALSLPSNSNVNVDTTNWDLTCQNGQLGSFTPTADGWLMLHVANSGTSEVNFWIIGGVIRINSKSSINTSDNNNFNMITIPVEKDVTYDIYGNASEYVAGRSIRYCRFMPCQGNV